MAMDVIAFLTEEVLSVGHFDQCERYTWYFTQAEIGSRSCPNGDDYLGAWQDHKVMGRNPRS